MFEDTSYEYSVLTALLHKIAITDIT